MRACRIRTAAAAALAFFAFAGAALAQFSPGPLSMAHEKLEGTRNCLKCHGMDKNGPMEAQCLACHEEIAWLMDRERGLHGRDVEECSHCHMEHAGKDFDLVDPKAVDPEHFDHRTAGWVLAGKHGEQKCGACHKAELRVSPAIALAPAPLGGGSFLGLERECRACHEDPHKDRFGNKCGECHKDTGFHDVDRKAFDHDRTRYPLRGAHARAECALCHDETKAWGVRPAFETCSGCHGEAHGTQLAAGGGASDCSACHDVERFRPSTFTAARHGETVFPLRGRHSGVPCDKCHPKHPSGVPAAVVGRSGVHLRPGYDRCAACHADAHRGELSHRPDRGACESCHSVDGWRPSLYTVEQHRTLSFPFDGRHAEAKCAACHRAGGDEGGGGTGLRFEDESCTACHMDPHAGRYAAAAPAGEKRFSCVDCHEFSGFRPGTVDARNHDRFRFALEGAHRATACFECHGSLEPSPAGDRPTILPAVWTSEPIQFTANHDRCRDCHDDPHRAQFEGDCARCHDTARFRPAARFVHDRDSKFPLAGAHAKVACDKCHPAAAGPDGEAAVTYKPTPVKCEACHAGGIEPLDAAAPGGEARSPGRISG
ncbi:MAG: hypothetical protein ABIK65_04495 [Candidatus Eisenbacteria bacterium]